MPCGVGTLLFGTKLSTLFPKHFFLVRERRPAPLLNLLLFLPQSAYLKMISAMWQSFGAEGHIGGMRGGWGEGGRDLLMCTHRVWVPLLLCSTPGYSPRLLPQGQLN